jgi:hypothetical protein
MSDDDDVSGAGQVFLAVVAFLLIKGLIDAKDAHDRRKVKSIWKRVKGSSEGAKWPSLWGEQPVDPWV